MTTACCWIVGDDREHGPEFYGPDVTEDYLRGEFEHVERREDWDCHAPEVPAEVLLADGWWLYCGWCEHEVAEDRCETCDDNEVYSAPVCVGGSAYCSQACLDASREDKAHYALELRRIKREGTDGVAKRWPDAYEIDVYPNDTKIKNYTVKFKLPWLKHEVRWEPFNSAVLVAFGDIETWKAHESEKA